MKVMCIDDKPMDSRGIYPKFGEIVTVSQCPIFPQNYDVAEYPNGKDGNPQSMRKTRFIPISDIDETELVKERELVC